MKTVINLIFIILFCSFCQYDIVDNNKSITQVKPKLILVSIYDDYSSGISNGMKLDKRRLDEEYKTLAYILNYEYIPKFYKVSDNYSNLSTNVKYYLEKLKTSDNDILVFHYNGHGENYPPKFKIPKRDSSMRPIYDVIAYDAIIEIIKTKESALSICVADCCANMNVTAKKSTSFEKRNLASISSDKQKEKCKNIFTNSNYKFIAFTSCSKGESSITSDKEGSVFTNAFFNNITKHIISNNSTSWDNIFEDMQKETVSISYEIKGIAQTPTIYKKI